MNSAMDRLHQDLVIALRRLRSTPGFTLAAILTLALGVGANTTIFSGVNALLFRPMQVERQDELVTLDFVGNNEGIPLQSYPNYRDLRDRNDVLAGLVAYRPYLIGFSRTGETSSRVLVFEVSGNYFDVLGVKADRGRLIGAADDVTKNGHPVVVVSHSFWQQRLGSDPNAVGSTAKLNGLTYTIIGVAPAGFFGTELMLNPDVFVPIAMQAQMEPGDTRLPVQEQMELVQGLAVRTLEFTVQWPEIDVLDNVIEQMLKRSEFESRLSVVEEEVRALETSKSITYIPAQRRLQTEVSDVLRELRAKMDKERPVAGPSESQLREIRNTMSRQTERGEYKQVLLAYESVVKDLALAEADPLRKPLVDNIKRIEAEARTVLDFDKIALRFDGRAYVNGQAIAVINGKIVGVGDLLDKELLIHSINREEIEFLFRGIVFARRF